MDTVIWDLVLIAVATGLALWCRFLHLRVRRAEQQLKDWTAQQEHLSRYANEVRDEMRSGFYALGLELEYARPALGNHWVKPKTSEG